MSDADFLQSILYLPHRVVYNAEFAEKLPEGASPCVWLRAGSH